MVIPSSESTPQFWSISYNTTCHVGLFHFIEFLAAWFWAPAHDIYKSQTSNLSLKQNDGIWFIYNGFCEKNIIMASLLYPKTTFDLHIALNYGASVI